MQRTLYLLLLVSMLSLASTSLIACGGGGGMGGLANMVPGAPKTTEVELTMDTMCPKCSKESHAAINPFDQPVKYTKVSIEKVDAFVEAANKTYGSVMVAEKLLTVAGDAADGSAPAGFQSAQEVRSLATGMMEAATKDIPTLISSGQDLVTNLPGELQSDPTKALVLDKALTEVKTSIERLNEAQAKLTGLGDGAADEEGGE
ncbi:MAG: hypothetical protein CMH57_13315 [Myxococcales bacterium]|nr:hypothetical protein [Myxococcales bacterium]